MDAPLHILLVEDSPTDALLIRQELQAGGWNVVITRVETESDIRRELLLQPDVVMADFCLPGFTAIEVLNWFLQAGTDAPLILVSGTIDTETAVTAMRSGATDYILKRNLAALPGALQRALESHNLKRAKRSAEDKVAFLARMLDLAQDAIIVCDFERSQIQYWNKGAQKLYGWSAGEVMGRDVNELIGPAENGTCAMIKGLIRTGEWSAETYRARRDGTIMAVSERATLARDGKDRPSAILFIHHDITDRKRAEEQIRYQEALIRETGEFAKLGSWEFDIQSGNAFWTAETARILGLEPSTAASLQLALHCFRGEHLSRLQSAITRAVEKAVPYDLELELTAADGVQKWVHTVGHPVSENGKVVRMRGILQDVTFRKRADDQIRDQAQLLNLTTDAILVSDFSTGKIVYWNQGAERMHGWTAAEAIGRNAGDFLLQDAQAAQEILRETGSKGLWHGELRERTKEGREIIVSSRVTVVRGESGQPQSLLSIHSDVTDQKVLEAQFLRAQRLESVGTLASGVAHDLNNILSPIIMAGPLLDSDLPPEVRKAIVKTVTTSARRGVEIVRQVLTFARGVKGQRLPVNCEALIGETSSIASETFPKSINLKTKTKPGLWTALGDSTQLQQILLNLAINARDAMPDGGALTISARNFSVDDALASMTPGAKPGPYVLLQVADTGTGIPKAIIDKIFDPFFSTKEVGQGTGLGLSTVLGIVKSHGGFLKVCSEPGQGTTFKIFIPASADGRNGDQVAEEPLPLPAGNGEMVLLVEDEPNIRVVAELILQQAGYRVVLAADGTEAIALYCEYRKEIQVVITDAVMPFLDGAALTRALRNLNPAIKIVGASGNIDDHRVNELQALALEAFLTKPYDRSTLLTTLHQVLQRPPP